MERLPAEVIVREMLAGDLPRALALSTAAGWNQQLADWQFAQGLNPGRSFVAEAGTALVGTAVTIDYGGRHGWIAMVLVHPDWRRHGVGTALFAQAVAALAALPATGLDATPMGRPIYERFGFQAVGELVRLVTDAVVPPSSEVTAPGRIRAAGSRAVPDAVAALDAAASGLCRPRLLAALAARAPDLALVHEDTAGAVDGFVLARPGRVWTQLGPLVAADTAVASALLRRALGAMAGRPAVIDVPAAQTEMLDWLATAGFREQRRNMRMWLGPAPATVAAASRAVAGPDLG